MAQVGVLGEYLWWHYTSGAREMLRAWMNVHRFLFHFFSIPILFRTFFAPFHRIQERRRAGFNPEDFFETLVVNVLMRVVGAIVRTAFIIVGVLAQCIGFAAGLLFVVGMLAFPAVLFISVMIGLSFFL